MTKTECHASRTFFVRGGIQKSKKTLEVILAKYSRVFFKIWMPAKSALAWQRWG